MDARLLLLLLLYVGRAQLRPTKPLEQTPGELEWEAWLLVKNNQPDAGQDVIKRITPKSIFTVRPFSADLLPPCAEGYSSDPMGRCIKFIKIDQQSHLGFLMEKLHAMYSEADYEDEEEEEAPQPAAGPLQFSIPLRGEPDDGQNDSAKVAIVVAPTNGNFNIADPEVDLLPVSHRDEDLVANASRRHNTTMNVIPLTKDFLLNLTSFSGNNSADGNETVLSLIDDLMKTEDTSTTPPTTAILSTIATTTQFPNTEIVKDFSTDPDTIKMLSNTPPSLDSNQSINFNETNSTMYVNESVDDTQYINEQNESQALFFLLNTPESLVSNASLDSDTKTVNITTTTESNPKRNNTKVNAMLDEFNNEDVLPLPADDEIKIDRFLSSIVQFPNEASSSGDYKSSFFNSRLNGVRFPSDATTTTKKSDADKLQTAESIRTVNTNTFKPDEYLTPMLTSQKAAPATPTPVTFTSELYPYKYPGNGYSKYNPSTYPIRATVTPSPSTSYSHGAHINHKHQTVKFPEYSHRNRDRNLFSWLEQRPPPTPTAASTKYYAPSSTHRHAYDGYYRKVVSQDYDRLFGTRRWNNR